tara:strand:- start:45 stop:1142 length:1098 start_codon:yes stop_codon:yes gene_type:complete
MFQCLDCNYTSDRKYNLQLHYKRKHKKDVKTNELNRERDATLIETNVNKIERDATYFERDATYFERDATAKENTILKNILECEKKHHKLPMDLIVSKVVVVDKKENLKNIFECEKCKKIFKTNQGLKRHKCNGVSDPLECQYCHKILASSGSKSRHIKTCKVKQAQIMVNEYQSNNIINHNVSSTTNQQQNNMIVNHYHFYSGKNKNMIEYESDDEKYNTRLINNFGEEIIDYIHQDELKNMALNLNIKKLIELKHFNKDHPENQNIRINDKKSVKVLRNNEWKVEPKTEIMNQIFNKSKAELYICSTDKIFYKELGERETEEKIQQWIEYEKIRKKKVLEFIDIQLNEIIKKRRKEFALIENKI